MQHKFIIREVTSHDVEALSALHYATFNETHGSFNSPTLEMRKWQWQKAFDDKDKNWFCIVIEHENEGLVGFAKGQSYNHVDHPSFAGELNKIYLLRKYHKLGLGQKMICRVAEQFLEKGINSMLLFGDANNPSNKFYEKVGAEKIFAKTGEFHGGYGWNDLQLLIDRCHK
jgi:L-amino acid N-acyltransferase YncA